MIFEFNSRDDRLWDHAEDESVMIPILAYAKLHNQQAFSMDETLGILQRYGLELAYQLIPQTSFLWETQPEKIDAQIAEFQRMDKKDIEYLCSIMGKSLEFYQKTLERRKGAKK